MRSRRGVQFCESAQVIHAGFPDSENCEALIDLIHEVINHAGIETTHMGYRSLSVSIDCVFVWCGG